MDKALKEKLLAEYIEDLASLEELQAEKAEFYSSLTDEELIEQMKKDIDDVYNDASENNATVGAYPSREG